MAPPDSVEEVDAKVWLLSVAYAAAETGANPLKDTLAICVEVPLFVNTRTTELSVFWKAPMMMLDIDPEVAIR
jgi:hypothetical protein